MLSLPSDFRSALRMPHSNHVENRRIVCGRRASVKKGAAFRKLFTTIGGAHFKSATEIVVNNSYLFDGKKLKVFKFSSGKKIRQTKIKITAGHSFAFDSKYNLYLTGYFYDDVYKLDKKGRTKWHTNIKHLGFGDAYGTTYKRGILTIYYEYSPNGGDLGIDHQYYIKFDVKTGKVLSYRK